MRAQPRPACIASGWLASSKLQEAGGLKRLKRAVDPVYCTIQYIVDVKKLSGFVVG